MFKPNTVVIVGAGASFEAGLPLGTTLKRTISRTTRFIFGHSGFKEGDYDFWQDLLRSEHFSNDQQRAASACAKISRGISYVSSIDSFLEVHRSDPDIQYCAKSAIVKSILDGERASNLYVSERNTYNTLDPLKLDGTWFHELAHATFEGVDASDVSAAFSPVTFISFNYDRCIEWFFYNAIQGLYFLDRPASIAAIRHLKVLHPYGDVGQPAWLDIPGNRFGTDDPGRIGRSQNRIKTFTEKSVAPDTVQLVRSAVADSAVLIFLGFAFHPQNMELLRSDNSDGSSRVRRVYGTSMGMSEQDCTTVEAELVHRFSAKNTIKPRVKLLPISCSEFMRQFKRSMTVQSS